MDYVSFESLASCWIEGMSDSVVPQYDRPPNPGSYSSNLRNLLFGAALVVALFPIPVTAFGLLPTYQQHARFLILYTPVICLLAVGYLFYLRDSLARLLFADIISFHPEDYEYQPEGARILGRLRSTVVALLPVLLLLVSFYCFTTYTRKFSQSLELTTAVMSEPAGFRESPRSGRQSRPVPAAGPGVVSGGSAPHGRPRQYRDVHRAHGSLHRNLRRRADRHHHDGAQGARRARDGVVGAGAAAG